MQPGGFRVALEGVPGPILMMFVQAHQTLRQHWTLSLRMLEVIRLHSAFQHDCHT